MSNEIVYRCPVDDGEPHELHPVVFQGRGLLYCSTHIDLWEKKKDGSLVRWTPPYVKVIEK